MSISDFEHWNENIEDFLTDIDQRRIAMSKYANNWSSEDRADFFELTHAYNQMIFLFSCVLNEIQDGQLGFTYSRFVRRLTDSDTIITFNWDCLLDRCLHELTPWRPTNGYGLSFDSIYMNGWLQPNRACRAPVELLKLHGSTNWVMPYLSFNLHTSFKEPASRLFDFGDFPIGCFLYAKDVYETYRNRSRPGYPPYSYFYYPPSFPRWIQRQKTPDHDTLLFGGAPDVIPAGSTVRNGSDFLTMPMIVGPVRLKDYDFAGNRFRSLWTKALRSMATSDVTTVIGYSFPPTDTEAWRLLQRAVSLSENQFHMRIVDPYPRSLAERIRSEFGMRVNLEVIESTFESAVAEATG